MLYFNLPLKLKIGLGINFTPNNNKNNNNNNNNNNNDNDNKLYLYSTFQEQGVAKCFTEQKMKTKNKNTYINNCINIHVQTYKTVQSYVKASLNKFVFSCFLKVYTVSTHLMSNGRAFQSGSCNLEGTVSFSFKSGSRINQQALIRGSQRPAGFTGLQ